MIETCSVLQYHSTKRISIEWKEEKPTSPHTLVLVERLTTKETSYEIGKDIFSTYQVPFTLILNGLRWHGHESLIWFFLYIKTDKEIQVKRESWKWKNKYRSTHNCWGGNIPWGERAPNNVSVQYLSQLTFSIPVAISKLTVNSNYCILE